MSPSRLSIAIDDKLVSLPESGRIVVYRPRAGTDLSALPRNRVQVVQGFRPDHDSFVHVGFETAATASGTFSLAIVFLPRAKIEARALIAEAAQITGGGPVVVDGQKTDGVDSILKDCRKRGAEIGAVFSKAHGKIFVLTGGSFDDWTVAGREIRLTDGYVTLPGLFSSDAIDRGSAVLAAALPKDLSGRVADLGAGWGYLASRVLRSLKVTECHLVEAEHAALDCARRNVFDPRARFHWADATAFQPDTAYDAIVMNPPFHTTRAAEPDIGRAFIQSAARMIRPNGVLWLVANRHLPYEAALTAAFHEVSEITGDASFKVFRAARPRRKPG